MSKEIDIEIYKHISNEMEVTEIYLGHIPFAFHYTQAQYKATCTEAFPFNPFDKVICELLKVEEQLSLENIGDILGMNVYESENPKRYLDLAEKEILTEALQSLASSDFRMIEGGDIKFSSCRLTPIGREYAEKKSKFKITANKPFTIFFDHTTSKHTQAKQHFEFVDGKLSGKEFAIELADEAALKEIAEVQIPEIYNIAKQYSFTDAVLLKQKNMLVQYPVAITYNIKENIYRLYCYDTANKRTHNYFNDWLNNNQEVKQQLIDDFAFNNSTETVQSNSIFGQVAEQLSAYPENTKVHSVKSELLNKEFVDEQLFYSSFSELINSKEKVELYLCLPFASETVFKSLSEIVQKSENEDSRFYFVFPVELSEKIQNNFNQLEIISKEVENLYVMQQAVKSFSLCSKKETDSFYIEINSSSINNIPKNFFQRKNWDARSTKIENYLLEKFSDKYALQICDEVNEAVNVYIEEAVSKEQLDELAYFQFKLEPFANIGKQAETVNLTLELIESFRTERIELLEEKLENQLDEIETKLATDFDEKEFVEIQKAFNATKAEIVFEDSEAFTRSKSLEIIIATKKEEFAEAKRIFTFIIDTNAFIKDPEIISKIQAKNKVIIAAKVLDELDGFKANPQLKEVASKSIREIFADKNKNIHRAKANVKLLPIDFNKRAPDNLILAVALIYKDKHGILITDDKGLHEKAKTVEMEVITYDNFISKFINSKK
jgi:rRNA-processing protein FCF1